MNENPAAMLTMAGAATQCFKASICKMNENPAANLTKKAAAAQSGLRATSVFPTDKQWFGVLQGLIGNDGSANQR